MDIKTGIDIVYIPRMQSILENADTLKKLFHENELQPLTAEHLAGIFAVKEAFFKAIEGKPSFLDVEIKKTPEGKPVLEMAPAFSQQVKSCDISISHEKDYAVAHVILLTERYK